jgi:hypothetical protein
LLPELSTELSPEDRKSDASEESASLKELLHTESNEVASALEEADESHGVIVVVAVVVAVTHVPSRSV